MMFDIATEYLFETLHGSSTPVVFSYIKKDGSMRNAIGTLNEKLIPEEFKPKDASSNNGKNLKYFDLEKNSWRSLKIDCSIVTIIE